MPRKDTWQHSFRLDKSNPEHVLLHDLLVALAKKDNANSWIRAALFNFANFKPIDVIAETAEMARRGDSTKPTVIAPEISAKKFADRIPFNKSHMDPLAVSITDVIREAKVLSPRPIPAVIGRRTDDR